MTKKIKSQKTKTQKNPKGTPKPEKKLSDVFKHITKYFKSLKFFQMSTQHERKQMTNEKILSSLRKMGVATQTELETLQEKIRKIEATLQKQTKTNQDWDLPSPDKKSSPPQLDH